MRYTLIFTLVLSCYAVGALGVLGTVGYREAQDRAERAVWDNLKAEIVVECRNSEMAKIAVCDF